MEYRLKYLGDSLETSGYRLYKIIRIGKRPNRTTKRILISWTDKRCKKCGRFVSKLNTYLICDKCSNWNNKKFRNEYMKKWLKRNKYGKP